MPVRASLDRGWRFTRGDWREEIITSVSEEVRICTTTRPAVDRRVCSMRDPIYRIDVCGAAQGYLGLPGFRALPGRERG